MDIYFINDGFVGLSNMFLIIDGGIIWEMFIYFLLMNCMQFILLIVGFGGGVINLVNDFGMYMWIGNFFDLLIINIFEV